VNCFFALQKKPDLRAPRRCPLLRPFAARICGYHFLVVSPPVQNFREDLADACAEMSRRVCIGGIERENCATPSIAKILGEIIQIVQDASIFIALRLWLVARIE